MTEPQEPAGLAGVAERVLAQGMEIDSLRRLVDMHRTRLGRVDETLIDLRENTLGMGGALEEAVGQLAALTTSVAELGEAVADLVEDQADDDAERRVSWLTITDRTRALLLLGHLSDWLDRVYLRYPDSKLPPCWMWHPHVVEELLWLWRAWLAAWHPKRGTPSAAADWCDRYRPGVSSRIAATVTACSLDQHGVDQPAALARPRRVGLAGARADVAEWWTTSPSSPAPYPTPDLIAEAEHLS